MKQILYINFFICILLNSLYCNTYATNPLSKTDQEITTILTNIQQAKCKNFADKLVFISKIFINKPYLFNALGEGQKGAFDDNPLYRTDFFDCETYVDTVMALAFATNLKSFQKVINQIRYKNGKISFTKRNHFTCIDWNQNNQKQ